MNVLYVLLGIIAWQTITLMILTLVDDVKTEYIACCVPYGLLMLAMYVYSKLHDYYINSTHITVAICYKDEIKEIVTIQPLEYDDYIHKGEGNWYIRHVNRCGEISKYRPMRKSIYRRHVE